jgi:hypothetical protein
MTTDVGELLHWADGLKKAAGRLGAEVAGEVRDTAGEVAELGGEFAPVGETGELSTEIEVTSEGSGRSKEITTHVRYLSEHAHFVHYGTSRQKPNPFADRALAAVEDAHVDRLRRIVEEVIPDE